MTLIEVLVVLIIIAFFVMMMAPNFSYNHGRAQRISCSNNLKQMNLAEKIWAGDNHDQNPMAVSVTNGGSMELMDTPDAWKTYLIMSNELATPKVLYCPEDALRGNPATNFDDYLKSKISYFFGVDAAETNPAAITFGDDNFILNNAAAGAGLVNASTNALLTWDTSRHFTKVKDGWLFKTKIGSGNIGLGDGGVCGVKNSDLQNYLEQTGFATNRFFVP